MHSWALLTYVSQQENNEKPQHVLQNLSDTSEAQQHVKVSEHADV